jgi:DNA polymerase III delta prime subunit
MRTENEQWLQKYHPSKVSEIVGNARVIRSLKEWVSSIRKYPQAAAGTPSPVPITFLYGPGGIGKTSIAHTILTHFNYHIHELNAGEIRSKKRIHDMLENIMENHSVSMMKKKGTRRPVSIVMDEIDGMSCGDKGGLHELFHIMQHQTDVTHPIICISDRPYDKKFPGTMFQEFQLRHPSAKDIAQRLRHICECEDIGISNSCLELIVQHGKSDVRRTIHFLQEVVYHCGNKRNSIITANDIHIVIELSSQPKTDYNIADITRDIFSKPLGRHELHQMHSQDRSFVTMMLYENLPAQLLQKKIANTDNFLIHAQVMHNLCLYDSGDAAVQLPCISCARALMGCGNANLRVSPHKTKQSVPKQILYTNILTKVANQSSVNQAIVSVSKQIQLHPSSFHFIVPLIITRILQTPSDVTKLGVSFQTFEKVLQIYNKWLTELDPSARPTIRKRLSRLKKICKAHLAASP